MTDIEARVRLSVPLDRAAHRRDDPEWLTQAWHRAKVLVVAADGRALIRGIELVLLPPDQVARPGSAGRMFLGVDEQGTPYFAVTGELPSVADARPRHLWEVGAELSVRDARLFAQALGLAQWHADYRHSPMTGSATEVVQAGWVRRDGDGELHFPRTDPAVIMLVHDGVPGQSGRALLGSGALWTPAQGVRRYSTLAGFIEPGESAEAAVIREVLEEVGVNVTKLRYVGSQPWPYPRSLMLGFTALADPAEPIVIDPAELADARWFTREEISAVREGSADGFRLPNRSSIAHRLVEHWLHDGAAEIR